MNINQAAKQYYENYSNERRDYYFQILYDEFERLYGQTYYKKIANNENLNVHDVQATYEDALLDSLEIYDVTRNFENLLRKSVANRLKDLKRKEHREKNWNELLTNQMEIYEKYSVYHLSEQSVYKEQATDSRQLIRDLKEDFLKAAKLTERKKRETVDLLEYIERGYHLYQAAKQAGISRPTVRDRLNKIAGCFNEDKYGYLCDYFSA